MSKHIGEIIKEVRLEKNIRQNLLAEKIGITKVSLNLIESGKAVPHHKNLEKISKELKTPVGILYLRTLDETDVPKHRKQVFDLIYPYVIKIIDNMFKE